MRSDARKLFEKLNKREFRYREFDDSFPDLELWPIFEALLRDTRVVGTEAIPTSAPSGRPTIRGTASEAAPEAREPTPLFARYHEKLAQEPSGHPAPKVDLRDFFGRIAENG